MRRLVILGILIILISSMLIAGCVFEEEKEKKKDDDDNGDNGNGATDTLNITSLSHEPVKPTAADDVVVTAKIVAENDIISVSITFCNNTSGICNIAGDMALVAGTEDTYTYTMPAGTYGSGTEVGYHVIVTDSQGHNDEDDGIFTL